MLLLLGWVCVAAPFAVLAFILLALHSARYAPPPPPAKPTGNGQWVWVPGYRRGRTYVKGHWRRVY